MEPKRRREETKEVGEANSWLTKAAGQPNSCLTNLLVKQTMVNFLVDQPAKVSQCGLQHPRSPKSTSKKWKLLPKLFKIGMPVLPSSLWSDLGNQGSRHIKSWDQSYRPSDTGRPQLASYGMKSGTTGNDFERIHQDNSTTLTL